MKPRRAITAGVTSILVNSSLGCSDAPIQPPPAPPTVPSPPIRVPPPFPAVPNASAIYVGPENLYDAMMYDFGSSAHTRFVLFSDSTFQMQFSSFRFGVVSYDGQYSRTGTAFGFSLLDWGAAGTLRGDTLEIRFGLTARNEGFLDGAYVLSR